MKYYLLPLALAPLAVLAACGDSQPEVVGGPADPMAEQLANAAPITLPPAVKDSRTYRCKDNSLIFVDFLADDVTANLRTDKAAAPVKLVADKAGDPFKADGGYEVAGSGAAITATLPGKEALACKA